MSTAKLNKRTVDIDYSKAVFTFISHSLSNERAYLTVGELNVVRDDHIKNQICVSVAGHHSEIVNGYSFINSPDCRLSLASH